MMDLSLPRREILACRPTPLQLLPRASERWGRGHRLWVKRDDLTGCLLSGNKVRKLEFIAAHALDHGYDTLITCGGLQSNHCRATAFAGAQLGLPVHLVLRGEQPQSLEGNLLLDHLAGAAVSCYPPAVYRQEQAALLEHWRKHYADRGRRALVIPTGGSDGLGAWGYIAACEELADDLRHRQIAEAHVVTATGSGGTQAGLSLGVALLDLPLAVWGVNVCDDAQTFLDKVAADAADWSQRSGRPVPDSLRVQVLDGYVGEGYAKAGREVFELIAELAALEGILLDPVYTGKAFQGLLGELQAGRFEGCRDIIFLHTGGTFGVFPQAGGFNLRH